MAVCYIFAGCVRACSNVIELAALALYYFFRDPDVDAGNVDARYIKALAAFALQPVHVTGRQGPLTRQSSRVADLLCIVWKVSRGNRLTFVVWSQMVMLMRQSWFGISSCLAFLGAWALALIAWLLDDGMKPTRPSHMDMSGVAILFITVVFAALITLVQLVGLVLGIVGLRQNTKGRSAAQAGVVLNGAGVLCAIITAVVLCLGFGH